MMQLKIIQPTFEIRFFWGQRRNQCRTCKEDERFHFQKCFSCELRLIYTKAYWWKLSTYPNNWHDILCAKLSIQQCSFHYDQMLSQRFCFHNIFLNATFMEFQKIYIKCGTPAEFPNCMTSHSSISRIEMIAFVQYICLFRQICLGRQW